MSHTPGHADRKPAGATMIRVTFPFRPCGLMHKHGGRIFELTRIGHTVDKPKDGHSRDYWYFIGDVVWSDGSISHGVEIAPHVVCYDGETQDCEGFREVQAVMAELSKYLLERGEWCVVPSKHVGWYASKRK